MPVTFAPAQPMSAAIAEGYGATEQFNKTLPTLAGLYQAQANRQAASRNAEIAADVHNQTVSAENFSRESIARDTLAQRELMADREMRAQQAMQQKQIDAAEQAHYMDWAMRDSLVSQQEIMLSQRKQQGLNQLVQMTQDGSLDMSDPNVKQMVADITGELKTGINFTQRRAESQHAKDMEAQAKLRDQQAARITKSEEDATKYESDLIKAGYNTIQVRDGNGFPHVLIKNKQTGEWYNPMKDTLAMAGKGAKNEGGASPDNEWGYLARKGTNQLDEGKAMADAEKWAKFNTQPIFKADGTEDKAATAKKIHETAQARLEGIKREFNAAERGGENQPAPPPAFSVKKIDKEIDSVSANEKLPPQVKGQLTGLMTELKSLVDQNPNPDAKTILRAKQLYQQIERVRAGAMNPGYLQGR